MSLTRDSVKNVAKLARLGLTEVETDHTLEQLKSILGLINRMQKVDTTGIEPLAHPLELNQKLRIDQVDESSQREKYQSVAPEISSGLYLVPRVIE